MLKLIYILLLVAIVLLTVPFALISRIYETLYALCLFLASKIDD